MIHIRHAVLADIDVMLPMLREFAEYANTKHSLYPGDEQAEVKIAELIQNHIVFVAEVQGQPDFLSGRIIGFIAGLMTDHWMREDITILSELLWWVEPVHRGSRAGADLLKHFMDYGEQNAHQMTMTLENASPVKAETLEARGFHLHERTFLKELHV